jgi:hypothetical protein
VAREVGGSVVATADSRACDGGGGTIKSCLLRTASGLLQLPNLIPPIFSDSSSDTSNPIRYFLLDHCGCPEYHNQLQHPGIINDWNIQLSFFCSSTSSGLHQSSLHKTLNVLKPFRSINPGN